MFTLFVVSLALCAVAVPLTILVVRDGHRPAWLEFTLGSAGVLLFLAAIGCSAVFTISHWEMSRLALLIEYPWHVGSLIVSMICARVLLFLAGYWPSSK